MWSFCVRQSKSATLFQRKGIRKLQRIYPTCSKVHLWSYEFVVITAFLWDEHTSVYISPLKALFNFFLPNVRKKSKQTIENNFANICCILWSSATLFHLLIFSLLCLLCHVPSNNSGCELRMETIDCSYSIIFGRKKQNKHWTNILLDFDMRSSGIFRMLSSEVRNLKCNVVIVVDVACVSKTTQFTIRLLFVYVWMSKIFIHAVHLLFNF